MAENTPTPRKPRSSTPAKRTPRAKPAAPSAEPEVVVPDAETPAVDGPEVPSVEATESTNDTEVIVVPVVEPAAEVADDTLNDTVVLEVPASVTEDPAELKARLARLEAENAALRAETPPPPRRRRKPLRTTGAIVLILIGALLAPVAVVASWTRGLVVDTDKYVQTVAPIVDDPQVQAAIENRVTTAVVNALNLEELTTQATDALSQLNLPPLVSTGIQSLAGPLQDAVTNFVHKQVTRVVSSQAFSDTWEQANRAAHEQIVATLRGDPDAIGQISSSGELVLDLTPIIEQVKAQMVASGFTLAGRIPTISVTFPVASSADLVKLQNAYRAIDFLGSVLVWVSLILLAAGVLVAQRRSRALVVAGLALAASMALLAVGLALGRWGYSNALPPSVQRPDVAVSIYDQFVAMLRVELRVGLVLGLVLAIIAFFAGGSSAARSVRRTFSNGSASLRSMGDRHGVNTGPVGVFLDEQRVLVRVVVIGLAVLVLVLADTLTGKYVATVAIVALLILGLATLLARPKADREAITSEPGTPANV